ncbi:hypothetical protein ES705_45619 [subsurface metagenome]
MEYISAIAMCILVIITYLYLKETKKIRQEYEKSFYYELSPKAFLEDVISTVKLNEKKRSLKFFINIQSKDIVQFFPTKSYVYQHFFIVISQQIIIKMP